MCTALRQWAQATRRVDVESLSVVLVAAAAATTTAATAAVAATTAAAATALALLGLIDLERATIEVGAVQSLHGTRRIGVGHFHKPEPTGAPRLTIGDEGNLVDGSVLGEQGAHRVFGRAEREVANVQLGHFEISGLWARRHITLVLTGLPNYPAV